jgi:hypothetical protein
LNIEVKLFVPNEKPSALLLFNNVCMKIRGDYSNDLNGLMNIWGVTLELFSQKYNSELKELLHELIDIRPHWKEDIYRFENTQTRVLYYFYRCCDSTSTIVNGDFHEHSFEKK